MKSKLLICALGFIVLSFALSTCSLGQLQSAVSLIIPTEEQGSGFLSTATSALPTPSPTPSIPPVEVLYANGYLNRMGYYHVVGEVQNTSSYPVTNVKLRIRMLDANGNVMLDKYDRPAECDPCFILMNRLDPGEKSAFDYDEPLKKDEAPSNLDVQYLDSSTDVYHSYADGIIIEKLNVFSDDNEYTHLTGEFVNTSNKWVWLNYGEGIVLNANGQVIAASSVISQTYLAPAGDLSGLDRTPFQSTILGPLPEAASEQIFMHAYEADPSPTAISYSISNPYFYTDGLGYAHFFAFIENTGGSGFTPDLDASVFDPSGNVLGISLQDFPWYVCLEPGQKLPINFSTWLISKNDFDMSRIASQEIRVEHEFDVFDFECAHTNYISEDSAQDIVVENKSSAVGGVIEVTGKLVNTFSTPLKRMYVVVYFTNANGDIVGMYGNLLYPDNNVFAAGESAEFEMTLYIDPNVSFGSLTRHVLLVGNKP